MSRILGLFALLVVLASPAYAQFDHSHAAWTVLLKRNVVLLEGNRASQVRYAEFARERAALKAYLASLSKVTEGEFRSWGKTQQMAFLINAYNGFTIEKILTRYPNLKSIKDFGSVFGNPWKDRFFTLFGRESFLDEIEHEMLRKPGVYDEPRVHYAVNCASIGCPMLREEAYIAERLDAQLEEQTVRFLSDRTRNRFSGERARLEVSRIYDWFKVDWASGYKGIGRDAPAIHSPEQFFARYARLLADDPEQQKQIAGGKLAISFLEYDWNLNDAKR